MRAKSQSVLSGAAALTIVGLMFVGLNAPDARGNAPTPLDVAGVPASVGSSSTISTPLIDAASAVRGSLGGSLEDLSLSDNLGQHAFFLNGGFALLFGLLALILGRRRSSRMEPTIQCHPTVSKSMTDRIDAAF
jgi:hypothetical protein